VQTPTVRSHRIVNPANQRNGNVISTSIRWAAILRPRPAWEDRGTTTEDTCEVRSYSPLTCAAQVDH
jgi:hypothetical protein